MQQCLGWRHRVWNSQKHNDLDRYLKNETLSFAQIRKFINDTSMATLCQNKYFCSRGNL